MTKNMNKNSNTNTNVFSTEGLVVDSSVICDPSVDLDKLGTFDCSHNKLTHLDTDDVRKNQYSSLEFKIEMLDKIIDLNPNDFKVYASRASARVRMGNYKEAIEDCNKATELGNELIGTCKDILEYIDYHKEVALRSL